MTVSTKTPSSDYPLKRPIKEDDDDAEGNAKKANNETKVANKPLDHPRKTGRSLRSEQQDEAKKSVARKKRDKSELPSFINHIHLGFCVRQRKVPMRTITVFCEVERLSSRETAQRTILIDTVPPRIVLEKVSLTVQVPQRTERATSEVSFSSVAGSEGYRTPEQSLRIEIVTPPTAKPRQIFASPSRTSSESDRHPPPKVADLKSIAEETQRIIQEATTGTAMERIPAPTLEKNRETLADRLSKGIHDLTQGSSDRLQRWKTKLQSGNHSRRHKDQSEPPPSRRPPMRADMDTVSDWNDRYPPRPLHPSRSASNALQVKHFVSGQNIGYAPF
ncbi:unnamed protein product [Heligmosomoides polygyrus]|uniref:Uncharacterized protein n=1 Tax=Heligmosomoides polygyrus TaxID=6339 RepID=A0A183FHC9_HELPZ|nr:unnamed protein product [Heligmosomoides polygyrus]